LQYKGFHIKVIYSSKAGVFIGEVVNIADIIAFQAADLPSLEAAMQDTIDRYLEFWKTAEITEK